jgi:hypothetical protein
VEHLALAFKRAHWNPSGCALALHGAGQRRPYSGGATSGIAGCREHSGSAAANPDCQLTLDDIKQWEKKYERIPDGAVVAMFSGWDAHVNDARKFLGLDDKGTYHLPGFSLEAVQFLHEQRNV